MTTAIHGPRMLNALAAIGPGRARRRHRVLVVRAVRKGPAAIFKTALTVLILTSVGCATTPSAPKTITDPKQLVGSWNGFVPCHGCAMDFRASLLIREQRGREYLSIVREDGQVWTEFERAK